MVTSSFFLGSPTLSDSSFSGTRSLCSVLPPGGLALPVVWTDRPGSAPGQPFSVPGSPSSPGHLLLTLHFLPPLPLLPAISPDPFLPGRPHLSNSSTRSCSGRNAEAFSLIFLFPSPLIQPISKPCGLNLQNMSQIHDFPHLSVTTPVHASRALAQAAAGVSRKGGTMGDTCPSPQPRFPILKVCSPPSGQRDLQS